MKTATLFPFLWTLLITIAFDQAFANVPLVFKDVNDLNTTVSGITGYKCNFADGAHDLRPQLNKSKSVLCKINSYFVYDTIELIVPSEKSNPEFQLKPITCFKNVYKDLESRTVVNLENDLNLVDPIVKEEKKDSANHISLTISPFHQQDVHFFCVCDNSKTVNGTTPGRVAFVEVNVLKYPYEIVAVNLTDETFSYLPSPKKKEDFVNKVLELTVTDGQLVVLVCKRVDEHCFLKPKTGELYRSTKVVFHKTFVVFKAPFFSFFKDVSAACTCKIDNDDYEIIIKPNSVKSKITGCDFTNTSDGLFSTQVDLVKDLSKQEEECVINLNAGTHNTLVGIHCPGVIYPDCFFQVYSADKKVIGNEVKEKIDESQVFYIDHRLGISGLEFYETKNKDGNNVMKIFSLVGNISKGKSFSCLCKTQNKVGLMTVRVGGSARSTISTLFLIVLVVIIMIV